jgi:DNA-binding response OmpR family regulator
MSRTALLIDGDAPSAKLSKLLLEADGWMVVVANSVEKATLLLRGVRVDIVLVELTAGDVFTQVASVKDAAFGAPVIAVTALDGPETELRALEAGCFAFVRKPIDVVSFAMHVRSLLEAYR